MSKKQQICHLLKGIETGDPSSVTVVNEAKYIQHNPQTHEGSEGLATLFKRLSKTSPKVNIVRVFEDGDYIFAHTEYDFDNRNIGFEIFRFENGQAVEHWDNIQKRLGPNENGYSMVDGSTSLTDLNLTETNRRTISSFVNEFLINNESNALERYLNQEHYIDHNPNYLNKFIYLNTSDKLNSITYNKCHRILAEGNFVLSVCEGYANHNYSSFFDLFRLHNGSIVEHWDTTEAIPPQSEWKNHNGKF